MINRFDTFTKLKEVVLGKVNYSLLPLVEDKNERQTMNRILQRMDQVFADLENIFKSFDIKVWRPEVYNYNPDITLGTPYRDIRYVYPSLSPADNFLTISNAVVEMSSIHNATGIYDYVQYQHIWTEQFKQGSRWMSMPRPSYNNKPDNFEPYADAPCFLLCGDTIFFTEKEIINTLAIDWFKKEFPQFKFKPLLGTKGHLDSYFTIVKPGLALSGIPKDQLPVEFKNWDILEYNKEDYSDTKRISEVFQDDDLENTTLAVNTFSIDEENIIMMEHVIDRNIDHVKALEKNKVNIIPLKYDVSRWINQGISCICNPINRNGTLENYL